MTAQLQACGYTLRDETKRIVCEETTRLVTRTYPRGLQAIVLTGSLARDEATVIEQRGGCTILGDAEFFGVFDNGTTLPENDRMRLLCGEIEGGLLNRGVRCRVEVSAVHQTFFSGLLPYIFGYELKTNGQIVWGFDVLSLTPAFSRSAIPLEDGWRMLCNRLIELIDVAAAVPLGGFNESRQVKYATAKLYLDMATSLLLFLDQYAPSYLERQQRLAALARSSQAANIEWPIEPAGFSRTVESCTRYKLYGDVSDLPCGWTLFESGVIDAHKLWRWELAQLSGSSLNQPDAALWRHWARQQSFETRVRGWACALRDTRFRQVWRRYPSWLLLARTASLRYWIYRAATEFAFQMPRLLTAERRCEAGVDFQRVRRRLPANVYAGAWPGWRQVASEIVFNYDQYLTRTSPLN